MNNLEILKKKRDELMSEFEKLKITYESYIKTLQDINNRLLELKAQIELLEELIQEADPDEIQEDNQDANA